MTGNNLDDHLRHGVVIENTYGSVVSGNMIEECRGAAVVLDRDCYGIAISANVIAHNTSGGVELLDAWGCAISANTFVLSIAHGVRVGPASGRHAIAGNSFCNSYQGEGKLKRPRPGQDTARGILLDGTSDITITGNTFTGLAESAVKATGECKRLVLSGNVVADVSRAAPGKHAAFDLGKAEALSGHNAIEQAMP
jgi:nitrous oxidase accessory protein NosD